MLYAKLRDRLTQAIKASDVNSKNAIRNLIAKLQTSGQETDEAVISSIKILIKQNEEEIEARSGRVTKPDGSVIEISVSGQEDNIARLHAETILYREFLPDYLDFDEIKEILLLPLNQTQINAAKSVGAATGLAMKLLKTVGEVEGATVKKVVETIYSSTA